MNPITEFPLNRYWRRARLYPALIASAPVIALILTLVPWTKLHLAQLTGILGMGVLLYALSEFARRRGKRLEQGAADIGPTHTSTMLWHSDTRLHPSVKDPILAHVSKQLKQSRPTKEDEQRDPAAAAAFYDRCGNWMRDNTRGPKFELLFEENVAYGFHRNLLGLKPIGLVANALTVLIAGTLGILQYLRNPNSNSDSDFSSFAFVLVVAIAHAAWFLTTVNREAVIAASNSYARQLLYSCDSFITGKPEKKARSKSATK